MCTLGELNVCHSLGMPVSLDKLEGPSTSFTFLGLELDSTHQELCLPQTKLLEIMGELDRWSGACKTTKHKLLSLIGVLSFAARPVATSRLFLRRLITLSTKVEWLHHHICLTRKPRWTSPGGKHSYQTGTAMLISLTQAPFDTHDLELYSDASGCLGCGAFFQGC